MTGLDTNVLIRYLTQDDPGQAAIATQFIESELSQKEPGFISVVVLVELCWVLQRLYSVTPEEMAQVTTDFLDSLHFVVQHREAVRNAVTALQKALSAGPVKAGLPDFLIASLAAHEGCSQTVSFDRGAIRSAGMVPVSG